MKTTLEVPDGVFQRAEREAEARGITLPELMNQALVRELGEMNSHPKSGRVTFPLFLSQAPGTLNLTNEDIRRMEEEDLRKVGMSD